MNLPYTRCVFSHIGLVLIIGILIKCITHKKKQKNQSKLGKIARVSIIITLPIIATAVFYFILGLSGNKQMTCLIADCQSPIQAKLRPAKWLPFFRRLHSAKENWKIDLPMDEAFSKVQDSVNQLSDKSYNGQIPFHYRAGRVSWPKQEIHVFCYTKAQWLDVAELHFEQDGENSTLVKVESESTGLFPLVIPFAFVLNIFCFWFPFLDHGKNQMWIDNIANECIASQIPIVRLNSTD